MRVTGLWAAWHDEERLAADGLQVCTWHTTAVDKALNGPESLATLWVDVEDALTLPGRQNGTRGRGEPLPVDSDAADWRAAVRVCLLGWLLILQDDYRVNLSDAQDTVPWMVAKLGIHARRLLASEHADQLCSDLLGSVDEDGKRHGDLMGTGRRLAYRSSTGQPIRLLCPCGQRVKVTTDPDADMVCPGCGEFGVLDWWRQRLVGDDPSPMTFSDLVVWLAMTHAVRIDQRSLRHMADTQVIRPVEVQTSRRVGRPPRRFDPIQVAAVVLDKRRVAYGA